VDLQPVNALEKGTVLLVVALSKEMVVVAVLNYLSFGETDENRH
jgi:uncharacterized membrane protein